MLNRSTGRFWYWAAFAALQSVGIILFLLPKLGWGDQPNFVGAAFLLPGSLVTFFLMVNVTLGEPFAVDLLFGITITLSINAICWFAIWKIFSLLNRPSSPPKE